MVVEKKNEWNLFYSSTALELEIAFFSLKFTDMNVSIFFTILYFSDSLLILVNHNTKAFNTS